MRPATLVIVAIAADGALLAAQSTLGSPRRDLETSVGDIWSVWTSPAHVDGRDVASTALTLGAFALATRIDSATRVWMVTHERTAVMIMLSPIREGARVPAYELGSGQYLLPVAGALYVSGRLSHSAAVRDAGLGCAAGHLTSLGIRAVAYRLVARARPRITTHPLDVGVPGSHDWMWHSFFSGHIANSMACASFIGHRYTLGPVEAVPYAYATIIGMGRMADGEHWTSDTMLGAIVGYSIGRAIANRQLVREAPAVSSPAPSSGSTPIRRFGPRVLVPLVNLSF